MMRGQSFALVMGRMALATDSQKFRPLVDADPERLKGRGSARPAGRLVTIFPLWGRGGAPTVGGARCQGRAPRNGRADTRARARGSREAMRRHLAIAGASALTVLGLSAGGATAASAATVSCHAT